VVHTPDKSLKEFQAGQDAAVEIIVPKRRAELAIAGQR
jgi:hypothetical protein